jgi:single-strand DNA-binding protein
MNVITIAGILGKDGELRYFQSGKVAFKFWVADSEGRDKPTIWWQCSMWGKRAESIAELLRKGSRVTVVGRITENVYTDNKGQERKTMEVIVNEVALQGNPGAPKDEPVRETKRSSAPAEDDSDIPF